MRRLHRGLGLFSVVLTACGGAAGAAVAPEEHTAAEALGVEPVTCSGAPRYAEPLIIDLPSNARLDFEVAMKEGVAVVAYDCKSIEVLKGCKVEGEYRFAGVSRKERVVQISNLDDLAVNLPLGAAKLSTDIQSGRSIDLAMVLVGKRSSPSMEVVREDLSGSCEGATHFVRAATLGAFSMATGSQGKVSAVADVFGAGTAATSSSERRSVSRDGDLTSCKTSKPDAEQPPGECQSAIRLELLPFTARRSGRSEEGPRKPEPARNPCPEGYRLAEGICTKAAQQGYLCAPDDEADCRAQCEAGNGGSCYNLGHHLRWKKNDEAQAKPLFRKGCEAGVADSCTAYGLAQWPADKVNEAGFQAALGSFKKACAMGSGPGCDNASALLGGVGPASITDYAQKAVYAKRACAFGEDSGCIELAFLQLEGKGVARDEAVGLRTLSKSCDYGSADSCWFLGNVYAKGERGVKADHARAGEAHGRGCALDRGGCYEAGEAYSKAGDNTKALEYWERGCHPDGEEFSCKKATQLLEDGVVPKDPDRLKSLYGVWCRDLKGDEAICKKAGAQK